MSIISMIDILSQNYEKATLKEVIQYIMKQ